MAQRKIQEEHERAIQERTEKYQREYDPAGYRVCRGELYARQRDPALTIRYNNASFNMSAINGLPDVEYIRFEIDEDKKYLVAIPSNRDDKNAVRWCVTKPDQRKPRYFAGDGFSKLVAALTGWNRSLNYKLLAYKIRAKGQPAYLFDLNYPETHKPRSRKRSDKSMVREDYLDSKHPFADEQKEADFGMSIDEAKRRVELMHQIQETKQEDEGKPEVTYQEELYPEEQRGELQ